MFRVFLLLLSTIAGFWYVAYTLEEKGPGYVWVSYNNYSIETTFWIFAAIIATVIALVYVFVFLLKASIYCLKHLGFLSKNWGVSKSEQAMVQFRLAYADGHWEKAIEAFKQGVKKSSLQASDRIMATRSALKLHRISEAKSQLAELKAMNGINELSLRLLELDLAVAENNSGLALTAYSQLLRDFPKEQNLRKDAFHYFMSQGAAEKAAYAYEGMSRKQKKAFVSAAAELELVQVSQAKQLSELKPLLKHIHKKPLQLQKNLVSKAFDLDREIAAKALMQSIKYQQYDVLAAIFNVSFSEQEAVSLLKSVDEVLDENIRASLSAEALAGFACLNASAKLSNKALNFYQRSLVINNNAPVFKAYVSLLKEGKTSSEIAQAISDLAEKQLC